jgi:hypothetical protein
MAIIYSYPVEATPTTSDLLLGTSINNDSSPTQTYTIGSLASLVTTNSGTGTVTNVATANSTFINITGGPITTSGTLTASLSATGTPSSTTFLRGDNTWAPATSTGSPNIAVLNEGSSITTAVEGINFTGAGVTTSVGSSNDVTVNIPSPTSAVSSLIAGTGISVDQATGDVTVTNTGVTSLVAGTNITLTPTSGLGNVVVNATNNPGTVQSTIPGNGLQLDSGTLTSNPTLGVEYDGSNNYILVGKNSGATPATVPTSNDYIAFNQLSSGNVKSSTFATIPASALPLVQQYIDTGDANTVKNSTDTYNTTAKVTKIVTLTDTEYAAIGTPDPNTLYIAILDANKCTAQTMTLNTTNSITGGANYTLSGDTNGATYVGCEGEEFSFKTIATPDVGYYFSTPVTGLTVTGQITNPGANANQTLAGVIAADPTFAITATLLVVTDIQGPGGDGSGFALGGDITGATSSTTGTSHVYSFTTTCTANAGYNFTSGPTITNASGTLNGSQTVVTTITGTLALT